MKRWLRAGAFLLSLTAALAAVLSPGFHIPAKGAAGLADPRVVTANVTPDQVGVGSPFDVDLTFQHDEYPNFISEIDHIKIQVSSENSAISVGESSYTLTEDNNFGVPESLQSDDSSDHFRYRLYIPQKELKRTGGNYGILKFKITYYESTDDDEKAEYEDSSGRNRDAVFTVEYLVFAKAEGAPSEPEETGRLSVDSFRLDHSPVREGEKFSLTLAVKNSGEAACAHALCALSLPEGLSADGAADARDLGTLTAGARTEVTFPLACAGKMTTGSYAVGVSLSADGVPAPAAAPKIYVPVAGTKTDSSEIGVGESKPQIIIESYDFGGQAVTGGQEFTLAMNIRNTGAAAIENCKITVGSSSDETGSASPGSIFTPAKSSNTFFVSRIAGGSAVKKTIALLPKTDAAPNSYGVTVAFHYEAVVDGKRQFLDAQETITIPLAQPDRFEVGDAELQNPIFIGEDSPLSISYVNKGKSRIYNLAVKLEGNFDTKDAGSYIGNVDSGTGDSFQTTLAPKAEGKLQGTATFTYEDASGKAKTLAKDFSCDVTAPEPPSPEEAGEKGGAAQTGGKPSAGPGGWPLWLKILIPAAVAAAAVTAGVRLHRRKKKKELEALLADDGEDQP